MSGLPREPSASALRLIYQINVDVPLIGLDVMFYPHVLQEKPLVMLQHAPRQSSPFLTVPKS